MPTTSKSWWWKGSLIETFYTGSGTKVVKSRKLVLFHAKFTILYVGRKFAGIER